MSIFIKKQRKDYDTTNELSLIEKENRRVIVGKSQKSNYGIFGDCFSQSKEFVDQLCEKSSTKFYDTETIAHELGQSTVNIVISTLNALPNIKAMQTHSYSVADIHWKWDLIIEHENYFYPVQIKSSIDRIPECQSRFHANLSRIQHEINQEIYSLRIKYAKTIQDCKKNNCLQSIDNHNINEILKEQKQKEQALESQLNDYKYARPLFIWASCDKNTIKSLIREFAQIFNLQNSYEELDKKAFDINQEHQINILIKPELEKIKITNIIIQSIKKYLTKRKDLLTNHRQTLNTIDKPVLLEDVLTIKIAENALTLIQKTLKMTECFVEEITKNKHQYNLGVYSQDKYRLSIRKNQIKQNILQNNTKFNSIFEITEEECIVALYNKIQKLMFYDFKCSKPMAFELFDLLETIQSFATQYKIQIVKENETQDGSNDSNFNPYENV